MYNNNHQNFITNNTQVLICIHMHMIKCAYIIQNPELQNKSSELWIVVPRVKELQLGSTRETTPGFNFCLSLHGLADPPW